MGISYDHSQYIVDLKLILGEATSEIEKSAPLTDEEFYRCWIDPGFGGSISFIEADLYFERYSSVIQNVTWKWQMRSKGQSAWLDLHSAKTESWGAYAAARLRVGLTPPGPNDDVPFEMRLIGTASSAATLKVRIGTYTPSVRVMGETL